MTVAEAAAIRCLVMAVSGLLAVAKRTASVTVQMDGVSRTFWAEWAGDQQERSAIRFIVIKKSFGALIGTIFFFV